MQDDAFMTQFQVVRKAFETVDLYGSDAQSVMAKSFRTEAHREIEKLRLLARTDSELERLALVESDPRGKP